MSSGTILQRHRGLRWVLPVGILGVVVAVAAGAFSAKATPEPLPPTSPSALLASVRATPLSGLSGTVVARMSLGLPELPGMSSDRGDASMPSLLSGSHTLRVWYGGPDKQRVALIGITSEADVFHSGRDIWQWDSASRVATHTVLPAGSEKSAGTPPSPLPTLDPSQFAAEVLKDLDPSTAVTMGANRVVADRAAYDLVLTPRTSATRIGSVHVAIDGHTKVPLGVQVFAQGDATPAIDIAFSDVSFRTPSASYFAFTPPPGATVKNGMSEPAGTGNAAHAAAHPPQLHGSGWTAIVEYDATKQEIASIAGPALDSLQAVQGSWGSGRLLESPLVSVLVTSDNRIFAGAVDPEALYRTAAAHK